jgi:NADH:ubiquinone oxidoreductase subunit C
MNDSEEPWIGVSFIILLFRFFFNNMISLFLIKNRKFYFFLDIEYYYHLFNILKKNKILKINTIIDIVATHYPNNLNNEFELLYVNLLDKLNIRFFFKLFFKKENLIISISNIYKCAM